jgi:hypothetical protein
MFSGFLRINKNNSMHDLGRTALVISVLIMVWGVNAGTVMVMKSIKD